MNEVISSYIEESHRSLLAKNSGHSSSPQHGKVIQQKLPRLPQRTASPKPGFVERENAPLASNLKSRAICSISEESHEDALREIDRLMKKNKSLEDDLAIVSAKKLSFKSQALRNQKEMNKLAATLEAIQKDAKYQREDISYKSEMSQAAIRELGEMRDTHIREVRLLQRGLQARTDESYRNRVNEIADLVDSLGRAALQRDQANKEKAKLQQKCRQVSVEVKLLQEERQKYTTQNKALRTKLADVQRTNNVLMQPRDDILKLDDGLDDFSDDDFESELSSFEKRYAILDDGAKGLDHWVEKLHREKGRLEKRSVESSKDVSSLEKAVTQWKELSEQKDIRIEMLDVQVKELQSAFEKVQLHAKSRTTELGLQLTEERTRYENKLKQLQQEAEYARSTAQGYHSLSEKLQHELVRVAAGEAYAKPFDPPFETPEPLPSYQSEVPYQESPEPAEVQEPVRLEDTVKRVVTDIYAHALATVGSREGQNAAVLAQQAQFAKTGELLQLEVRSEDGNTVLYGHELSTGGRYKVVLDAELVQELDPEDPWTELFTVVGISLGPPKELVLPTLVGRREVPLAPCGVWMILTVYKYDSRRFFLNGFDPQSQRLVDLVLMEDSLTSEACQMIDSISNDEVLFDYFLGRLQLFESPPEVDDAQEDDMASLRLMFNVNANQ